MKKLTVISILLLALNAKSQTSKFPILIKGDFGSSNVKTPAGKGSSSFAYGIGVETFVPLVTLSSASKLQLNPGISYLHTGYGQSAVFLAANPLGGKVNVNYLSLALPICYTVYGIEDPNGQGLLLGVGPYINLATGGNFEILSGGTYDKKKINFGNSISDNRKSMDAGIAIKIALLVNPRLYIGMQINRGLQNTTPKDRIVNGSYLKVNNTLFYASYLITKKRRK